MSTIKVNIEQFQMVSKKFNNASDKCTTLQRQLEKSTNELLNEWEGESKEAFEKEYDILKQNMCNYSEMLKYMAQEITDIGNSFKESDEFLERQMLS